MSAPNTLTQADFERGGCEDFGEHVTLTYYDRGIKNRGFLVRREAEHPAGFTVSFVGEIGLAREVALALSGFPLTQELAEAVVKAQDDRALRLLKPYLVVDSPSAI